MATDVFWNPSFPAQIGLEARVPNYKHWPINTFKNNLVLSFVPQVTSQVTAMRVFNAGTAVSPTDSKYNSLGRPIICEIFEDGDETEPVFSYSDYRVATLGVSGVSSPSGMWNENLTAASGNRLHVKNDGLYILAQSNNKGMWVRMGDSVNLFDLNRTVIKVGLILRMNASTRIWRADTGLSAIWNQEIPFYQPRGFTDVAIYNGEVITEVGGSSWRFWQPEDIRNFAAVGAPGSPRSWAIVCRAGGGGAWKIDYAAMRVYYTTNDRVGMGVAALSGGNTFQQFDLTPPSGSGTLTLTAGQRYKVLIRQIYDYTDQTGTKATMSVRGMGAHEDEHPEWQPYTLNRYGYSDASLSDPHTGLPAVQFMNGSSTVPFSQPYNLARSVRISDTATYNVYQSVTITGAAVGELYGQVIASIGIKGTLPTTTRLRCEVFDFDSFRRLGGPVEMTVKDILRLPVEDIAGDDGVQFRRVRFLFPDPEVLGPVSGSPKYTIKFTCPDNLASSTKNYFVIPGYHWRETPVLTPNRTFGTGDIIDGNTNSAQGLSNISNVWTQIGATGSSSDVFATLAIVPGPVTDFASSYGVLTTHSADICPACNSSGREDCKTCGDSTLPFANLTWTPIVTGAVPIHHYEIERQDDLSPDWEPVAHPQQAEGTWYDYEARIGVQSRYRIRSVNEEGIPGEWSDTISVVVGPYGGNLGHGLCFSSNAAVAMSCVYPEIWGSDDVTRDFTFQEADDVTYASIYGRERQVAFWPAERKGVTFNRTLLLNAICTVKIPTMNYFQPIRDLAWAPIPYVCVRDGEGNRWYANIQVPEGLNRRPGEMWYASVTITEVSAVPAIHDTSVDQVEAVL